MANLLAHFEPTELIDFMTFIGLLMHRLQVCLRPDRGFGMILIVYAAGFI